MMQLKRGDTLPPLVIDLFADPAIDLTGATVRVIGVRDGLRIIDREVPSTGSTVTMAWEETDTMTAGVIGFEVEVTKDGKRQTFPARGLVWVLITPDTDSLPESEVPGGLPPWLMENPDGSGTYIVRG